MAAFEPVDKIKSSFELSEEAKVRHEIDFCNKTTAEMEAKLGQLQLVLLIDCSGSMTTADQDGFGLNRTAGLQGKWTRWDNCFQTVKCLAESMFEYDKDGKIPTIFFSKGAEEFVFSSVDELYDTFKSKVPRQTTNLLAACEVAFSKYINENDNTLFIVLTDGAPNEGQEPKIKELIKNTVCKADPKGERINILVVRHGDDAGAKRFLQDLDDSADIGKNVDTKSDDAVNVMGPKNLILNAIYEHLDDKYKDLI